jgi:hypothetical protein
MYNLSSTHPCFSHVFLIEIFFKNQKEPGVMANASSPSTLEAEVVGS